MLASRHLPEQVVKIMEGHEFVLETKFDGERIQVHKEGDKLKLFSRYVLIIVYLAHGNFIRNANDCTPIYGEKLIPIINEHVQVAQCILDGELLVWDTIAEKFEDFGKLKTFGTLHTVR